MKINELRIGNYVSTICGNVGRISFIAPNYVYVTITSEITKGEDEISGIPLTEEWLLKFGFYYQSSDKNYVVKSKQENNNSIKKIDGDWCYNNDYSDASCYFVRELRYIHELQNLYYALNEEELTIK